VHDPVAYHLIPADVWHSSEAEASLRPASLATEGFVHLTHRMADLVEVANAFYQMDPRPHVVLTVRLASLSSPWSYDGDDRFPHVYGPIDRGAITEARPIDRAVDGMFLPIERPDVRRRPDIPALLGALEDAGVAFIVIGSAGAALLGAELEPGDLDVCVSTDASNLNRLAVALNGVAARPRVSVPGWVTPEEADTWRAEPTRESLELLFETRYGDLDILFASLATDRRSEIAFEVLKRSAVSVEVENRRVVVAAPRDLLASKLAARRPKDLRAREALERMVAESRHG
jgi:uncharacterized protein (DUF952 family)